MIDLIRGELNIPMREDLLCYALGELDDEARRLIEAELERDAALREELDELKRCLADLDADEVDETRDASCCPGNLADRTAQQILAICGDSADSLTNDSASRQPKSKPRTSGVVGFVCRTPISLVDSMVAVGVMMVIASLVLPALNSSRSMSNRLVCQNNMSSIGRYLLLFARENNCYFPAIAPEDNAGSFAMHLTHAGIVDRTELQQLLDCPGGRKSTACGRPRLPVYVPTEAELASADAMQLAKLRTQMGGYMGYRIGYVNDGKYHPVRNHCHSRLAVLGDAPQMAADGFHSTNHDGGQNVFWQDGSVTYEPCTLISCIDDHLYLNNNGLPSAGLDWRDAVLAASQATPGIPKETRPVATVVRLTLWFRVADAPKKNVAAAELEVAPSTGEPLAE